jgi:hypothetical protein
MTEPRAPRRGADRRRAQRATDAPVEPAGQAAEHEVGRMDRYRRRALVRALAGLVRSALEQEMARADPPESTPTPSRPARGDPRSAGP